MDPQGKANVPPKRGCPTAVAPTQIDEEKNWRQLTQLVEYNLNIVCGRTSADCPVPRSSELNLCRSWLPVTDALRCGLGLVLGACVLASAPAYAQDPEQAPGPTLVRGDFTLESSLGVEALENSNIFESSTDVRSSLIWRLRPNVLMRFEPARSRLDFGYTGDFGWYDKSPADDYTDHALDAGAYLLLGERSGLDLVASYKYAHENRGAGLTLGIDPASAAFPQEPNRFTDGQFLTRYTYGVSGTRAFVALEASTLKHTYQNNLTSTEPFNRKVSYGQTTFGVRVQPKTSVELSVRASDITYDNSQAFGASQNSREYVYLLGVVWEATGQTTGTVRIGEVARKFADSVRPNFSGPSWEVAIRWSPRTYSHFDLATKRYTEEPVDLRGGVTVTAIYSLGWTHEWSGRLESKVAVSEVDSTYRFVTGDRRDKSPQYSLGLMYRMRRWLRWEAGVDIKSRDSQVVSYNYHENIAKIGARVSF